MNENCFSCALLRGCANTSPDKLRQVFCCKAFKQAPTEEVEARQTMYLELGNVALIILIEGEHRKGAKCDG